ncbi:ATP phosphoribosyltransferase [Candidatus Peregrinibacteria bacterium]|nr:ATP phosphoribosyltransferase [Candidatus Peregrinibacteria bacterium]
MNNVRIAIQAKGKLAEPSLGFLLSLGLRFKPNGRNCIVTCENCPLDILFLRDDDIPDYVSRGIADFGIIGENVLLEKNARVKILKKLGFGTCSLVLAVPENSQISNVLELDGKSIATTYPNLLREYLRVERIETEIIPLKGSAEIAPNLNLSDAICDLTQTGRTLKENNLRLLTTILESQAILIQPPFLTNRAAKKMEKLFAPAPNL